VTPNRSWWTRSRRRALESAAIACVVAAACGRRDAAPEAGGDTPRRGGTVRLAVGAEPKNLMPYGTASSDASTILGLVFMVTADTDSDLVHFTPALARRWEWSADSLDLVLHLRDDVVWSDGVPMTSDDVVFSFDIARDSTVNWRSRSWKNDIVSCRAEGPHTVRYRFAQRFAEQFRYAREGWVLPRHVYGAVDRARWEDGPRARAPVGCGLFVLARWEPGQRLVLERNPRYHDPDRPRLDRIVFEVVPDASTRVAQLRAGSIDFLEDVPARDAAALRAAAGGVRILSGPGRFYDYIAYNRRDPLFASRAVREALTRAIDRDAVIRGLCYGFARPIESPFVPIVWAYDASRKPTPFDPEGARRILAQEGWRDSDGDGWLDRDGRRFEFTLLVSDNDLRRAAAVPVQANWKAIGVKVDVDIRNREAVKGLRDVHRFQATYGGWTAGVTANLRNVWGCDARPDMNFVSFCDPVVDSLNQTALALPPERALPLFHAAQRRVAADHPYTWMYYLDNVVGVGPRLHDVRIDRRGAFVNPEEWWVSDER
jgi:peptide/nickel transport system substrate-binding protein